jgi:hypothetical protein
MRFGGNVGRSLRGNPEPLVLCRLRIVDKVVNLVRGGGLEGV